ncbi:MAG: hypothetical protein WBM32_24445 [Crocosphaera sp.]
MTTQFSWTQNWYPISPLSYLDSSIPTPVTLLGKKLVIWQNKNQQWVVIASLEVRSRKSEVRSFF